MRGSKNLLLVPEVEFTTKLGRKVYPDGTLKDLLRQDWGYWESKDEKDDLDAEIEAKFAKGYPRFNILFEDTQTAVLYQGGEEVLRAGFEDVHALDRLLNYFVSYEPSEVREFHKAIELYTADVQGLADTLRKVIEEQYQKNDLFKSALLEFLELSRKAINPGVPPQAWEYRLGTYTALEWVLERYKEKKPRDPTIREKFNTYRFADYKEFVIDLLRRVCTVSIETMDIIHQMPE